VQDTWEHTEYMLMSSQQEASTSLRVWTELRKPQQSKLPYYEELYSTPSLVRNEGKKLCDQVTDSALLKTASASRSNKNSLGTLRTLRFYLKCNHTELFEIAI
jgi:hypothetical protein